jgi:hypothetical protein
MLQLMPSSFDDHGGDVLAPPTPEFATASLLIGDQFRHRLGRDRFMHGQHVGPNITNETGARSFSRL